MYAVVVCRVLYICLSCLCFVFFFQAEDGIRDLVRSRGLGDVYKRQSLRRARRKDDVHRAAREQPESHHRQRCFTRAPETCLLYTSDAADERSSVDLGGRRIIKKKKITRDSRNTTLRTNIQVSIKDKTD